MAKEITTTVTPSEKIQDIAAKFRKGLKVEGSSVSADKDVIDSVLPENISLGLIKDVQNTLKDLTAGFNLAVGEIGLEAFKKDKKLDQVSGEVKVGHDSIGSVFKRVNEGRNPTNGETVTTYGYLRPYYTTNAGANKSDLAKVRKHLAERGAALLK